MRIVRESADLLVAGGGTAGHIAAIQAGRAGIAVSLVEAGTMLGGTMTEGGVFMPNHFDAAGRAVVRGIPWELYQKSRRAEGIPPKLPSQRHPVETPGYYSRINIPLYAYTAEKAALQAGVRLHYSEFVARVEAAEEGWEVVSYGRGIERRTSCREIIDATGDADAARALGLETERAETRQPGALQYRIEDIDLQQVWDGEVQALYEEALAAGRLKKGDWAYPQLYPFSWYLRMGGHNGTHIYQCDTSNAEGQTDALIRGRERMARMYRFVKDEIPGGERAVLKTMYTRALSREGYRVVGEHRITYREFMEARTYPDALCHAFNYIDLHSEENGCDEIFHSSRDLIPQIPFRALIPRGVRGFLLAGRIIASERKALAGLRAQCTCMAMGQAAGAAAALAVREGCASRDVPAEEIRALTGEHGAVPVCGGVCGGDGRGDGSEAAQGGEPDGHE